MSGANVYAIIEEGRSQMAGLYSPNSSWDEAPAVPTRSTKSVINLHIIPSSNENSQSSRRRTETVEVVADWEVPKPPPRGTSRMPSYEESRMYSTPESVHQQMPSQQLHVEHVSILGTSPAQRPARESFDCVTGFTESQCRKTVSFERSQTTDTVPHAAHAGNGDSYPYEDNPSNEDTHEGSAKVVSLSKAAGLLQKLYAESSAGVPRVTQEWLADAKAALADQPNHLLSARARSLRSESIRKKQNESETVAAEGEVRISIDADGNTASKKGGCFLYERKWLMDSSCKCGKPKNDYVHTITHICVVCKDKFSAFSNSKNACLKHSMPAIKVKSDGTTSLFVWKCCPKSHSRHATMADFLKARHPHGPHSIA